MKENKYIREKEKSHLHTYLYINILYVRLYH
jgi:hypothetical protein